MEEETPDHTEVPTTAPDRAAGSLAVTVCIPTPLRSYTGGAAKVVAAGSTVTELLYDLDRQYPGIRFRMVDEAGRLRRHMNVFVQRERCRALSTAIETADDVVIMQALSGG